MWTIPIALFGHGLIWLACFNHSEATGWPKRVRDVISLGVLFCMTVPPLWIASNYGQWWLNGPDLTTASDWLVGLYLALALCTGSIGTVRLTKQLFSSSCKIVLTETNQTHDLWDLAEESPSKLGKVLQGFRGNEIYQLDVAEKELLVRGLPQGFHGFTIAHLTDLHFTGEVSRAFYEYVVDQVNKRECDLVVITGDICDNPHLIEWIEPVLGKLQSKHGVFAILGNHDRKVPRNEELAALAQANITYLGGSWQTLQIQDRGTLVLAGNELPWIRPAADMNHAPGKSENAFRILLSHAPDQLKWAQQYDFDLMLAGHTHGGQIRLPFIGAVVTPSRMPLAYAFGIFDEDNLALHVSRGLGGEVPIRLNCQPELAILTLHAPVSRSQTTETQSRSSLAEAVEAEF